MSLLPRRSLLAVAAVVDVALNGRAGPVSSKALAERHELGPRQFESLLQALVRSGILKGIRGPKGGYELARERRRITVAEIVEAASRAGGEPARLPGLVDEVVAPAFQDAERAFLAALATVSVEHLCSRAEALGAAAKGSPASDFTI